MIQVEKLKELHYSVNKGKPYGKDKWIDRMIERFKLNATLRNPGRPKKAPDPFYLLEPPENMENARRIFTLLQLRKNPFRKISKRHDTDRET